VDQQIEEAEGGPLAAGVLKSAEWASTLSGAMGHSRETTLRVRYAETDQMGVAYHGNYFAWFEVGRTEFLRELGFDYKTLEREEGCYIVVADASCRYKAAARYDDLLRIRTELRGIRGPVLRFGYTVLRDGDGALLAEGETAHLVADMQMKVRTLPEKYLRALEAAVGKDRDLSPRR
jgi:acyl-CoA thioester hydrolase